MNSALQMRCGEGGEITVAQSTFVEIICGDQTAGGRFRVHYKHKQEVRLKPGARFESLEMCTDHPLLIEYQEPSDVVYLDSRVADRRRFISLLERAAAEHFGHWRTLYSYVNAAYSNRFEEFFDEGFGIMMDSPRSFTKRVLAIAQAEGVDLHIQPGAPKDKVPQLMLLGEFFVIADGFRVERCNDERSAFKSGRPE